MHIIFILSLPRSGSTLLQRLLATHSAISTVSEPWLLLPIVYATKEYGVYAEYGHAQSNKALHDFIKELPRGAIDFDEAIRLFYFSLCQKISGSDKLYFLDKTPRYTLIAEDLSRIFPDAKFIVLWRNPLAIIASMLEAWSRTHWNMHHFNIDLYPGVTSLVDFVQMHSEKIYQLNYENLVTNTKDELVRLLTYLGLPYEQAIFDKFKRVRLNGQLGDKTTEEKAFSVSNQSLDKWEESFSNILRKRWGVKYLEWLGSERLSVMGYDLQSLLKQLNQTKLGLRNLFSDFYYILLGVFYLWMEPNLFRYKLKQFFKSKNTYLHN
jgi:hypothetical protein